MKKKRILLGALAMVVAGAVTMVACKKDFHPAGTDDRALIASGGIVPGVCGGAVTGRDTLSGVLGTGHGVRDTIRLFSNKVHCLSGLVYVDTLDVLEIQAGAIIRGLDSTVGPIATRRPGGALIITRGGKIEATGNATGCPIIFTSQHDTTGQTPVSGDWAGVILLGRAPVNASNPQIEGVPSVTPADSHYGGTDASDNSGVLKYVQIRYAGYAFSLNNEINGLTLGGVGCGTTLDYIEVYKANDDAFEFFGGTVNATHLIAIDPLDDMYDFDNGFVGHIQFALGTADNGRSDQSTSNGIESDNDANGSTATPATRAEISNMTLIGYNSKTLADSARHGVGAHVRRNSGIVLENSIIMGFRKDILLDGQLSQDKYLTSGSILDSIKNGLYHAYDARVSGGTIDSNFVTISGTKTATDFWNKAHIFGAGCNFQNDTTDANTTANTLPKLVAPFNRATSKWFMLLNGSSPATRSTAIFGWTSCGFGAGSCSFTFLNPTSAGYSTSFRGAFGPTTGPAADNWASGWTIGL